MAAPPQIITRTEYTPLPAPCFQLRAVELPDGTTAQQVIERQHADLLAYRAQIAECAKAAIKF